MPDRADGALAAQSRTLRNSIISLAVFFALLAALLLGVPGLDSAADRIAHASPAWVAAGIVLEILSCAGYVVLFELVFGRLGHRACDLGLFLGCRLLQHCLLGHDRLRWLGYWHSVPR